MGNALTFPKICDRLNRRLLAQSRRDRIQNTTPERMRNLCQYYILLFMRRFEVIYGKSWINRGWQHGYGDVKKHPESRTRTHITAISAACSLEKTDTSPPMMSVQSRWKHSRKRVHTPLHRRAKWDVYCGGRHRLYHGSEC